MRQVWAKALNRLEFGVWPFSLHRMSRILRLAQWVVGLWADAFDTEGIKPAHILRPPSGPDDQGGFVWRWDVAPLDISVLGASAGRLVVLGKAFVFAYRAEEDGSLRMLFGRERQIAIFAVFPEMVRSNVGMRGEPCEACGGEGYVEAEVEQEELAG